MPLTEIKARIIGQVRDGEMRFSVHAHREMVADGFTLADVCEGLTKGQLLEDYPGHKRGACALFAGVALDGRPVHIVCTTGGDVLIVITVYEPKPPKWPTPTERKR